MTTPGTQLSLAAKGGPGQAGDTGPAGVGAQGLAQPSDNGLVAWSCDPAIAATTVALSAGIIYLTKVKMTTDSVINKVGINLRSAAPAGLTNTYMGVYAISGATATLLASTSDASATVNGAQNPLLLTLASTIATQPAGTQLMVAFLAGAGTTLPSTLGVGSRANGFVASKQNYRCLTYGTGQTALPGALDLSSAAAGDQASTPCFVLGA